VVLLLQESFRHAKAIGAWGRGVQALEEAGIGLESPGVVTGESATAVFAELQETLGAHRVWERFVPALV
jgi:catalase